MDAGQHNTWNGCVVDRNQNNDVADTLPDSNMATKFPATKECTGSGGLAQALPLTDIWGTGYQTLVDKVEFDAAERGTPTSPSDSPGPGTR